MTLSEEINSMVLRLDVMHRKYKDRLYDDAAALLVKVKSALERNELDAERYRWLRNVYDWESDIVGFDWEEGESLDAAIDSARAGGEGK